MKTMEISCWNQCRENHPEVMFSIFLIYFSHFSFSAILVAFFHVRWKLHSSGIIHSFSSSIIIHSLVVFACCWSTLLCPDLTVNWFLILFSSIEFFSHKQDCSIVLITGTENEQVFLNKYAPCASLLFEAEILPFQWSLNYDVWEVVC